MNTNPWAGPPTVPPNMGSPMGAPIPPPGIVSAVQGRNVPPPPPAAGFASTPPWIPGVPMQTTTTVIAGGLPAMGDPWLNSNPWAGPPTARLSSSP